MKWLLPVVFSGIDSDIHYNPVPFVSEKECVLAAQDFVRRYPEIEWYDLRPSIEAILPVLRS
jgi:hypothetical protein